MILKEITDFILKILDQRIDTPGLTTHYDRDEVNFSVKIAHEKETTEILSFFPDYSFYEQEDTLLFPKNSYMVSLPNDCLVVLGVTLIYGGSNYRLSFVPYNSINRSVDNDYSGTPYCFYVLGNGYLGIWPPADIDCQVKLSYCKKLLFPDDDQDEVPFFNGGINLLIYSSLLLLVAKSGVSDSILQTIKEMYMSSKASLYRLMSIPRQRVGVPLKIGGGRGGGSSVNYPILR